MRKYASILTLYSAIVSAAFASQRDVSLLEDGWKFHFGDAAGAAQPSFDDSAWEDVRVPHDWAIGKPFDMNIDRQMVQVLADGEKAQNLRTGRTGALPCFGVGWYRTELQIDANQDGKKVYVEFDGAMSRAQIYLNGKYMGEWPYGYASFCIDVTPAVKFGQRNVLAVRLNNLENSSRWYSGAGLFRNVRMVLKNPIHVDYNGTFVQTPEIGESEAVCTVGVSLNNFAKGNETVEVSTEILDAEDKVAGSAKDELKFDGESACITQKIKVKNPKLWDLESPDLYRAVTKISCGGKVLDSYTTRFGFRTISYHRDDGFKLNGRRVQFKGVCMHHDLGPLGAAVNVSATKRQIRILQEMGCNAIRTSHNPPSPELLNLCDEMGMLVMDEAFDEWKFVKCLNGYNTLFDEWAEKDLTAFVKRDRNHPCVVMWSIGNEVPEQRGAEGARRAKWLADIVRSLDATRPVTSGMNWHSDAIRDGFADALDLQGFNYKPFDYKKYYDQKPNMIFYGSETASTVSSRGEYMFPVREWNNPWYHNTQVSSYDMECAPWSQQPDKEFAAQDDNPFVLGEFVWTGFDYLGEPFPYHKDSHARSSYFGIVDLGGLKKDRFYLYQSRWSDKQKVLHVLPHWNWEDRIGQKVPVFVYTNYPKAELFVNGKSMGVKAKSKDSVFSRYRLMWNDVVYQPGEIKVVAYGADGKPAAEKTVKTAGEPAQIKLIPEKKRILCDRNDLAFVELQILDKDGNLCPRANTMVFVRVEGNGRLRALCNGDASDLAAFSSNYMRAYNGKLMIVADSPSGDSGNFRITASTAQLKSGSAVIEVYGR